jgi:hypothetical protein
VYPKNNCPEVSACQDAPWFIFPLKGIPTHPGKTNEPGTVGCQNGSASPLKFVDVQNSAQFAEPGHHARELGVELGGTGDLGAGLVGGEKALVLSFVERELLVLRSLTVGDDGAYCTANAGPVVRPVFGSGRSRRISRRTSLPTRTASSSSPTSSAVVDHRHHAS